MVIHGQIVMMKMKTGLKFMIMMVIWYRKLTMYRHDDIDIISADEKYAFIYWIQAQDGVGQEVIGVIERDKIATHEAELIQLTKGMNGNSFER